MSSKTNAINNDGTAGFIGVNQIFNGPVNITRSPDIDKSILQKFAFSEMLDRRSSILQPYPTTCRWILETNEYNQWNEQRNGLLWIKGKPGAGKSTIMNFLYSEEEQASQRGRIQLEFFFSARGVDLQKTPLGMLRSLVNQLFRKGSTESQGLIRKAHQDKVEVFGGNRGEWRWQKSELKQLLQQAIVTASREQSVTIFIDALDEALDEAGKHASSELAKFFQQINDSVVSGNGSAKICISSRHYPVPSGVPGLKLALEDHNGDDIATFIGGNLRERGSLDRELWENMNHQLNTRAAGIFQWVALIVPLIEAKIDNGEELRGFWQWLQDTPSELGDVYEYILRNSIPSEYYRQAFSFFQWICLAKRPLSVKEMRFALATKDISLSPCKIQCHKTANFTDTDDAMELRVKALSGGLAEVAQLPNHEVVFGFPRKRNETRMVHVIHHSVNEFLFNTGLNVLAMLAGESTHEHIVQKCHSNLYRSCLDYLDTTEVKDKDVSISWRDSPPLLRYTTHFLFDHAKEAKSYRFGDLDQEVQHLQGFLNKWAQYKWRGPRHVIWWNEGTTLLHIVSTANLTDLVHKLVKSGKSTINVPDAKGDTALHYAARHGSLEAAQILYSANANHQARNNIGNTPLALAARDKHKSVVQWILEKKAYHKDDLASALFSALDKWNTGIPRTPLEAGPDVNAAADYYGPAPSTNPTEEIAAMLLEAGADLSFANESGSTSIHMAAKNGCLKTIFDLRENVDISHVKQRNWFGQTPLHVAVCRGQIESVKILLQHGADPHSLDDYGHSALDWASHIPAMAEEMREYCQHFARTSLGEMTPILQKSVYRLAEELLKMTNIKHSPGTLELGRCLMLLGQYDDALFCFSDSHESNRVRYCYGHEQINPLPCFVCKTCIYKQFCDTCRKKIESSESSERLRDCHNHDFLEIKSTRSPKRTQDELQESPRDEFKDWLRDLMYRFQSEVDYEVNPTDIFEATPLHMSTSFARLTLHGCLEYEPAWSLLLLLSLLLMFLL